MLRRLRLSCVLGLTAIVLLASAPPADAAGLINRLPEDGSWVVFTVSTEIEIDGNSMFFDRELRVSSVGSTEVAGRGPCRWIEVQTNLAGRELVAKVLVPEEFLTGNHNFIEHVERGWFRGEDGQVQAVDNIGDLPRQFILLAVGVPYFDEIEEGEPETVQIELGELECTPVSGSTSINARNAMVEIQGRLWLSPDVPFGLAKAEISGSFGRGSFRTELEAAEQGGDAVSALADYN